MPSVSRAFVGSRGRAASALGVVLLLAGGLVVVTGSVAAAAMSAQGVNFSVREDMAPAVQAVGTFTDTTPSPASGYTVSINWGDGQTTAGFVSGPLNGTFEVDGPSAAHAYATDGTYTVTFSITETGDDHDSGTATAVATVLEGRSFIGSAPSPINAREGTVVSGTIGTFYDINPVVQDPAANFTASIDWGDGTTTAGIVTAGSTAGYYNVSGTHQYTDELSGSYGFTVSEPEGGQQQAGGTSTVTISEADALTMTGSSFAARPKTPFSGMVATFIDTNPSALSSDFATTINWGDGTTTPGTVTGPTGGPFTVTGSHTYARAGTFSVTVTAADDPRDRISYRHGNRHPRPPTFRVTVTATDDPPGTATASATATATVTHGRPPSG